MKLEAVRRLTFTSIQMLL